MTDGVWLCFHTEMWTCDVYSGDFIEALTCLTTHTQFWWMCSVGRNVNKYLKADNWNDSVWFSLCLTCREASVFIRLNISSSSFWCFEVIMILHWCNCSSSFILHFRSCLTSLILTCKSLFVPIKTQQQPIIIMFCQQIIQTIAEVHFNQLL